MKGRRAGGEGNRVWDLAGVSQHLLERLDFGALGQPVAAQDLNDCLDVALVKGLATVRDRHGPERLDNPRIPQPPDRPPYDEAPLAPSPDIKGKAVLVTGATGSFGNAFIRCVLAEHEPASVRVYSRDELKQLDMRGRFEEDRRLRFLIGDVRDRDRLKRAMHGIDVVIHAAALKQVPAAEYNPFEAVQTNVIGAENVVTAAIENRVPKTLALSTDKAVNPVNLYGATKLCAEKIFTRGTPTLQRRRSLRRGSRACATATSWGVAEVSSLCSRSRPEQRADHHRRVDDSILDHSRRSCRGS